MLHQTMLALEERGALSAQGEAAAFAAVGETVKSLDDLYHKAIQTDTRLFAVRYMDRALGLVRRQLNLRLIYLLDEFDALYEQIPAAGFSALRALRDDHKDRLSYLVASRHDWLRLRQHSPAIEAFEELVSPQTIWLGPYAEPDARHMLDGLAARHDVGLDETTRRTLLRETGGHSGLLLAAFRTAAERPDALSSALRSSPRIQDECRRIWYSLPPDEQQVVAALAAAPESNPTAGPVLTRLKNKGLVVELAPFKVTLFSQLFGDCLLSLKLHAGPQIQVDRKRRVVFVGDKQIDDLSPLPFKLLDYLERHRDQVCTRSELTHYLYPDEPPGSHTGSTDGRLDTTVRRLREAIEPDPSSPRYVLTVRGVGYQLANT
jgi:hypothetical protein